MLSVQKYLLAVTVAFLLLLSPKTAFSKIDSLSTSNQLHHRTQKRLALVVGGEVAIYGGLMIGLNSLWYKDYPKERFHFFNDNREWLQMDKIGHATTAYYVGKLGMEVMDWTGIKHRNAIIFGGSLGSIFLTTIEIFDGYSKEWGFSKGDILANTVGSALVIGEELMWNEQRVSIKFSYTPSTYAQYRPAVLGTNFQERILKDYNAQTYWLSVNIGAFLCTESKFPKWLNVAVGYGADGMLGGNNNPDFDSNVKVLPVFKRQRQYYLSADIELSKIKTKSPFLKALFKTIGFIKFPSPTLELNEHSGLKFRPFFF